MQDARLCGVRRSPVHAGACGAVFRYRSCSGRDGKRKSARDSIGGADGQQFDAIAAEPIDAKVCSEPCAPIFSFGDGNDFWLSESEKYRFIVLDDVDWQTVTILLGGPNLDFEEALPKAQKVLETVQWKGA